MRLLWLLLPVALSASLDEQPGASAQMQQYVVTFKQGTDDDTQDKVMDAVKRAGAQILSMHYSAELLGFVGNLTEAQATDLRSHPTVKSVAIDTKSGSLDERQPKKKRRRRKKTQAGVLGDDDEDGDAS